MNFWCRDVARGRVRSRVTRYLAGYNVWPSQVRQGPAGRREEVGSVDKSLTMHRAGLQILVTSASPY